MNEHEMLRSLDRFLVDVKRRCFGLMELKSEDRILDVGCGLGLDVLRIRDFSGLRVDAVGVDLQFDSMKPFWEIAAKRGAVFVAADAAMLPFGSHFDVVWADRLFQHVDDPMTVLLEFRRVTNPYGRIVLADSDHTSASVLFNNKVFGRSLMTYRASTIKNASAGRMLHTWCKKAGFRLRYEETVELNVDNFAFAQEVGLFYGSWDDKYCQIGERTKSEMMAFLQRIKQSDRLGEFRFKSQLYI